LAKLKGMIKREGGSTAFSKLTGIPLRTVEDWKYGKSVPPSWIPKMVVAWVEKIKENA
jgi:hypothetical protein